MTFAHETAARAGVLAGRGDERRERGLFKLRVPKTWHRDILRRRWARRSRCGRSGRPPVRRNVRSVVLRLARENES